MTDLLERCRSHMPPFMRLLGIELVSVAEDKILARMLAREEIGNGYGALHGGAYMAFADYIGALGTILNLPKGCTTTTLESKTNFFAPAGFGQVVHGESVPLHRGRRTMAWQTRLTNADGRLLALVTQTQMVLTPNAPAPPQDPSRS